MAFFEKWFLAKGLLLKALLAAWAAGLLSAAPASAAGGAMRLAAYATEFGISSAVQVSVAGCGAAVFEEIPITQQDAGAVFTLRSKAEDPDYELFTECLRNGQDNDVTVVYTLNGGGIIEQHSVESDHFAGSGAPGAPDFQGLRIRGLQLAVERADISLSAFFIGGVPVFMTTLDFSGELRVLAGPPVLPGVRLLLQSAK